MPICDSASWWDSSVMNELYGVGFLDIMDAFCELP